MITELRIRNARIYDGREWSFPLSRLTILCGTNSAGKSTLLKCLLLLRQNLIYREPSFNLQNGPRLRFSNSMTDLGNFKSFVSHNDTTRELHLGVTLDSTMDRSNYAALDPTNPQLRMTGQELGPDDEDDSDGEIPYKFDADFYFGVRQSLVSIEGPGENTQLELKVDDIEEDSASEHRAILRRAKFCIRTPDGDCLVAFDLIGRSSGPQSGLPEYYLRVPMKMIDSFTELSGADMMPDDDPSFGLVRVVMPGLYPERVFGKLRVNPGAPDEVLPRFWPVPPFMDEAFGDLRVNMNRIFYLGPLRAPAKRYYPIQADSSLQNDVSGELLPILLRDRVNSTVTGAAPRTHTLLKCRLLEAVNWWLRFMRTGISDRPSPAEREIKIESLQDVLVEMGVRSGVGSETHSLADSGFGYSQLLPILVRGLILPPNQTLMVEQPEVHLNPALQVRLSDFFVAMSSAGKQIIIETHSEHIVNAIRAITAERDAPTVANQCTVLYIEANEGRPQLHKLSVLPDGTIPEWPQSFFGESAQLLGRILRAHRKG